MAILVAVLILEEYLLLVTFLITLLPRLWMMQGVVVFVITTICCLGVDVILVLTIIFLVVVSVNVIRAFRNGSSRLLGRIRHLGRISLIEVLSRRGRQI